MTMNGKRRTVGGAALAAAVALGAWGPGAAPAAAQYTLTRMAVDLHDTAPHTVRRVLTARDVEVEVVDWGGRGPALIFLAGFGNTAHVWDEFAPRFTHGYHVIGITRRGFGASSKPAEGYDAQALARDVISVMDAMRLPRAAIVAHSTAGTELNWLAHRAPGRVTRLIYLDAGYDWADLYATPGWAGGPTLAPRMPEAPATAASLAAWYAKSAGHPFPESEVRALFRVTQDGRVGERRMADSVAQKLVAGTPPAAVRQVVAPVLAIYSVPRTVRERYPWYDEMTADEKTAAEARFQLERDILQRQRLRFQNEIGRALRDVVHVPGGGQYLFLSHDREMETQIRRFLLTAGRGSPRARPYLP
jgi:pimeloyl-ACP methyl ester carboxylesterase